MNVITQIVYPRDNNFLFQLVAENERRLTEAQIEKEEIQRRIKENQEFERDQERLHREKNFKYQDDLIQQMRYNQRLVYPLFFCGK